MHAECRHNTAAARILTCLNSGLWPRELDPVTVGQACRQPRLLPSSSQTAKIRLDKLTLVGDMNQRTTSRLGASSSGLGGLRERAGDVCEWCLLQFYSAP